MLPRWARPDELGEFSMSKNVQLRAHGGQQQAVWALRAWMLYRSRHDDWHQRSEFRKDWYKAEEEELQKDIDGVILTPVTFNCVQEWAPGVLCREQS